MKKKSVYFSFALVLVLGTDSMAATSPPMLTASGTGNSTSAHAKVTGRDHRRFVNQLDFLDANGRLSRSITSKGKDAMAIHASGRDEFFGVYEILPDTGSPTRSLVFKYYSRSGDVLWSARVCCDIGRPFDYRVFVSDDGFAVALLDARPGEECPDPDSEYGSILAPKDCAGVRVFSSTGKLLFSDPQGGGPVILSPRARWLIYSRDGVVKARDLVQRDEWNVPQGNSGIRFVSRVDDDGTVSEPTMKGKRRSYSKTRGIRNE